MVDLMARVAASATVRDDRRNAAVLDSDLSLIWSVRHRRRTQARQSAILKLAHELGRAMKTRKHTSSYSARPWC